MKLILSDRHLEVPHLDAIDTKLIDISKCKITNCVGCYGCWTKTPGKCVIRDDAVNIYPLIAASENVLYVSRVKYGSYDTPMKTMLERAIPIQQAFIRLWHGETHHVQRSVVPKQACIIGYGNLTDDEKDIFGQLVARNSKNMNFAHYRIIFALEPELEQVVRTEVALWGKS